MEIRKAVLGDVPYIVALYDRAREALAAAGVDQWQDGYPNEETAKRDIEAGESYVLIDEGKIICTAFLGFGHEPTYDKIEGGAWRASPQTYGFLHRIAVSPESKGKGAAGRMFEELKRQAKERGIKVIRGDTHEQNLSMQRVMMKSGLEYRGIITVEDGTPRYAYELIMD